MTFKFEKGKDAIIDTLVSRIKQDPKLSPMCADFARQFFGTVALEDLETWSIDDLLGAAEHFWRLIENRKPRETKIDIYNPTVSEHAWHSAHTIIEILIEDMPFLVDSVRMVIDRMGFFSHLIIHMGGIGIERDANNEIIKIFPRSQQHQAKLIEAPICVQIDRQNDPQVLEQLRSQLLAVLEDNRAASEDWMPMREKIQEVIEEMDSLPEVIPAETLQETKAFLSWIDDHHFTFLGLCDYQIKMGPQDFYLEPVPNTGLGILRESLIKSRHEDLNQMMSASSELTTSSSLLIMSKTNTLAPVHRNVYSDYIGIKRFNAAGEVIGERRVIGLYTSAAYNTNPKHIPFLRHKVSQVMKSSELNPRSHAGKVLLNILETLPRDDLIQASEDELLELGMGIFHLQERRRIRLFARTDIYGQFVSCLVYVPKENFNTELRQSMQTVLSRAFESDDITFSTRFSESVLARIHFLVRVNPHKIKETRDLKAIEQALIEVGRSWTDQLQEQLHEAYNAEQANALFSKYKQVFPIVYCENYKPKQAVFDIKYVEALKAGHPLLMHFYRDPDDPDGFRLKVFQRDKTIPLSQVLPIIENLGMRAISERPYSLRFPDGSQTWISDFSLTYTRELNFNQDDIQNRFQTAFVKVWVGEAENDGFNQLILAAGLNWRQVEILRAYAKYFKQIGLTFSQEYIEKALVKHATITKTCVALFEARFDPKQFEDRQTRIQYIEKLSNSILTSLNEVSNLDEDKILRQYVSTINATLRTNFYQTKSEGEHSPYLSLKFNSQAIPFMPKPYPVYEIFVYSPRVEGVHLRGGKVARGGLRWSDRREDFRTEVLGLMKAQQVKNAIIVPSGAKGGFIPKNLPAVQGREAILAEAVTCYQMFIRGLLDITDNYAGANIVKPLDVICYDENDPYLVVAADKGTATFSDYANAIALEYNFWLGDAFASGGSVGYDHKKMGITAKGAWESVKRHFYEMGKNIEQTDFTVVGIGDMAGDVFGNGMLLSDRIKLVAAFNHAHIFIDPAPDVKLSFEERHRMFYLPRSTWADYDRTRISTGGGVFERSAKSIPVSKEMKSLFGIKKQEIEPNELIRILLSANVDLLWSAGIGTFVKAEQETHADVGDRTNDLIRVNAKELRCKVIGEGGNLGLTQRARVEYDLHGGLIYTDFIDNSAGVNCSDKEVNIKILLNAIVAEKKLTMADRNTLLVSMTEEVSSLVLQDNIGQTRAISLAAFQASSIDLHIRYIHALEQSGKLDRQLENIPDDKSLMDHKLLGKGLGLPSLSVLQCYSKIILKEQLLNSDIPEDPFLEKILVQSFPQALNERFHEQMKSHPLRREIIATKLCNIVVNEMGLAFICRMTDETAAPVASIVRAYLIARSVLGLETLLAKIDSFHHLLSAEHEKTVLMLYLRLVRRMVRWLLRNLTDFHIQRGVDRFAEGVQLLKQKLPEILSARTMQKQNSLRETYESWGVSSELAYELSVTRHLFSAFDLIEASHVLNQDLIQFAKVYYEIGDKLDITWIRSQVIAYPTETHWEALSREAIRDDLDSGQRYLTESLIKCQVNNLKVDCVESWFDNHKEGVARWNAVVTGLKSSQILNYTMFFVAVRQLMDLTQQAQHLNKDESASHIMVCASS